MSPVCSDPTPMYRERATIPRAPLSALLFMSVLLSALAAAHVALYTFTLFDVPDASATLACGINMLTALSSH